MLEELLRNHDGVITLAQAREIGMSGQAVRRRVQAHRWRRCGPGVYFVDDRPFTDAARIRAAVWSFGSRACASGLAAAWWHGTTKFAPRVVEVTVPKSSNGRSRPGCRLRRRDLLERDVVEREGLRVTALALTVVEAAVRNRSGAELMDRALQRHVELAQLWRAHLRNKGRHGSPAARRLLRAADDGARSEAERILVKLLGDAGFTGWHTNFPVAGYKVDVAFVVERVAIEVDGWAFHSDSEVFQIDRNRQNAIALHGWKVLRFTWLDLTQYPKRVINEIAAATGQTPSTQHPPPGAPERVPRRH
ncbi:DUF559 domain-containing protein [Mycolicibacterium flavescens]|uniref:DUF559 domain-containing protein n=1 Tax=Mycolicibacterium flavescens TaxID=1776 RepID=A0A1E3RKV6_MYCFV|nr:DUF559 domain-containing protein [Mycolicibacterium flavescens]MCV7280550.1 DUF559 domain-containing protein [Mycolicibacterium flavescens]ODQ90062.1 hypothetical protein BHQ18_11465 [Mycolicibacterium flavescens]